jgi:hypothetical protein
LSLIASHIERISFSSCMTPPVTFYSLLLCDFHIGTINWLIKYWLYTHWWENKRKRWWWCSMTTNKRSHYAAGGFYRTEQQISYMPMLWSFDVDDTRIRLRANYNSFRCKQTALIHSLTYSMEWRLTLPFRSAEHTYCYSLSHALTFTYSSNVNWLFIIVEQRNKKEKNRSRRAHTIIQLSLSDIDYAYIYICMHMIVLFYSNIKLCTLNRF